VNDPIAQRCSGFARSEDLDPAGTAGSCQGYVAVDVPLACPRELTEHPDVSAAAPALAAAGVRVQGIVPDPASSSELRRMVTFLRPHGPFDRYRTAAWTVPATGVGEALSAVAVAAGSVPDPARRADASGTPGPAGTGASDAGPLAGVATLVAEGDAAGRHVLVCTHGARDACCGSLGTRLATVLPGLGAGVQVWRTSHTGGHRFAPTALLLPEGTAWAYLDLDTLVGIADRTLDIGEATRRYRGCAGLDGPEVQAADREALLAVGWSWLDHHRSGAVVERSAGGARVRLDGIAPDGARASFEATIEVARLVPVPDCGKPLSEARKSEPELRVRDFAAA
jgi:hypothetical protein